MKIKINTINGGGQPTFLRLFQSLQNNVFPYLESQGIDWEYTVLSQGPQGTTFETLHRIKNIYDNRFHALVQPRNIGTPWASNELIDWCKKSKFDYFWMIDDDLEILTPEVPKRLLQTVHNGMTTACTAECFYGPNYKEYRQGEPRDAISVGDNGSGCTLYKREVFDKVGYHDEDLIQYGHDSEFNRRIKKAFGPSCLGMVPGKITNHFPQQATKISFHNAMPFGVAIGLDQQYIKRVGTEPEKAYMKRKSFSSPLFERACVQVI
jgi:glycosyltransferase involved in cell wall biosynthesis